jgi:hypothetical protein
LTRSSEANDSRTELAIEKLNHPPDVFIQQGIRFDAARENSDVTPSSLNQLACRGWMVSDVRVP